MSIKDKGRGSAAALSIITILILLCYFAVFALINFRGFEYFATTDIYEDTLVARMMVEEKTLFPKNFLWGNQFYVVATPVLAAGIHSLGLGLNDSMAAATTVMSILILISLNWMLLPFVKQRHIRCAALLAMVAAVFGPVTAIREDGSQLFFTMCSFYACYLITYFVLLGDYARSRESDRLRPLALILALFLSFCTGMQSLRQTCVSMLPILCFECMGALLRLLKKQPLFPKEKRMSLYRSLGYLAANIAGMLYIDRLGVKRNEIFYGQSIFSGASLTEKLGDVHKALITVSGFDFTRESYSLFFLLIFLFFTLLIFAAFFILVKSKDKSGAAAFWIICIISILAVIAASFVTSVSLRPIYLFPYYTLPAISFVLVCGRLGERHRNILCTLLCIFAFLNIYFSYHEQIAEALDPPVTPAQQICDFAMENGYSYVYGSHSNTAPYVAVYSDGALTAGGWNDYTIFNVNPHINPKYIYYLSDYQKAIFAFLPHELEAAQSEIEPYGVELTFHGQYGNYSVYTSPMQLMYPISENIDFNPEYN